MGFPDAVRSVLTQYVGFAGRARRSEYWWFFLFSVIVSIVASLIDQAVGVQIVSVIAGLALLLPSLAVGARRLHDTGRTGWWQLIALIPFIGFIVLIVFFCIEGDASDNKYGPSPKAVRGGAYGQPSPYGS